MRIFVRCHPLTALCITALMLFTMLSAAAYAAPIDTAQVLAEAAVPTAQVAADSAAVVPVEIAEGVENSGGGLKNVLKNKFIEGNASFMSLVALALVLGLAFCIERIIYLSLSEINAKKFMREIDAKIEAGDIEGAKTQCRNTRGPVASICYQACCVSTRLLRTSNARWLPTALCRRLTWRRAARGLRSSSLWHHRSASWAR